MTLVYYPLQLAEAMQDMNTHRQTKSGAFTETKIKEEKNQPGKGTPGYSIDFYAKLEHRFYE
jgi:hypothetical protein